MDPKRREQQQQQSENHNNNSGSSPATSGSNSAAGNDDSSSILAPAGNSTSGDPLFGPSATSSSCLDPLTGAKSRSSSSSSSSSHGSSRAAPVDPLSAAVAEVGALGWVGIMCAASVSFLLLKAGYGSSPPNSGKDDTPTWARHPRKRQHKAARILRLSQAPAYQASRLLIGRMCTRLLDLAACSL